MDQKRRGKRAFGCGIRISNQKEFNGVMKEKAI